MKLATIIIFVLAVIILPAEMIQIGEGNLTNQGLPFDPNSHYSYSQQLYLSSEIGGLGLISSLSFQYYAASEVFYDRNNELQVWMGHHPEESFAEWVEQDQLTLCFDGILPISAFSGGIPGTGWMTVVLQTPFMYEGEGSLVIAVRENSPGRASNNDEFFCESTALPRGLTVLKVDPINPDELPDEGYHIRNSFPNLRLDIAITRYTPYQPSPEHDATDVSIETGFSFLSDAQSFDFWLGTHADSLEMVLSDVSHTQLYLNEPLQMLSNYYWQVVAHHDGNVYPSPVWHFVTEGEQLGPPRNLQAIAENNVVHLQWEAPLSGTVVEYLIYRNDQELATTPDVSYLDEDVVTGATYVYWVRARNHLGQLSAPSASVSVHIPYVDPLLILHQGFEDLPAFSDAIPGWMIYDLDNSPTWTWADVDFPHSGEACGWMTFASALTTPPLHSIPAHGGRQMLISPDALNPPDNNWLISPLIHLGTEPNVSFWARSATADYGLERLKVLVSEGSTDPQDFTALHSLPWLDIPASWTRYQYDLSAWQGQTIRIAWQAVSLDALALFLDDIKVRSQGGWVTGDNTHNPAPILHLTPNPSKGNFWINMGKAPFGLEIYDLRGRLLHRAKGITHFEGSSLRLASGVYLIRTLQNGKAHHGRLVIIK